MAKKDFMSSDDFSEAALPGVAAAVAGTTHVHTQMTPGGQPITVRIGEIGRSVQNPANVNIVNSGRSRDPQYENQKRSMEKRHEATGISPATILNFLPIPLVVNSPMAELKVFIPPAPLAAADSDAFSFHVWHDCAIEVNDLGEGMRAPVDFYPVQLAKAFLDEYADFGGVVLFKGLPDAKTLARPDVVQMIEDARNRMNVWMTKKVEEGNMEWNSPNHQGAKNIVELHRQCALRLKDLGLIDHLPEWVTESRSLKDVATKCPSCASVPQIGAVRCPCGYVLNPAKAYIVGDITEEDAALERLTRAEVVELGISLYVSETIDEKKDRLAAGRPKPMSVAQQRAMQAQPNEPVTAL